MYGLTVALEVRLVGLDDRAPHIAGGGHGGVLDCGVVARGHLEVLTAGGEGPFEVDFGRVRVDAARYGHVLLQGGSNHGDGAAAADGRICWRHDWEIEFRMELWTEWSRLGYLGGEMRNNEQLQLSDGALSISSIYIANILLTGQRNGQMPVELSAQIFNLSKAAGVRFFLRYGC